MPPNLLSTIIKLVIASAAVGFTLKFFNITPQQLFHEFGATIQRIFGSLSDFVSWGLEYVILGAVVVVPIWAAFALVRRLGRGKGS